MLSSLWDSVDPGFIAPVWLLAGLAAVAILALLEMRSHHLRRQLIHSFAASHLVAALAGSVSVAKRAVKALLLVAAVGLLFIALARPYLFYDWTDETRSGLDVLIAVDCSKSMLTEDVHPNRLDRAKLAIFDFASHLPEDRLGLIAFAGDAFLQCPLTLDHDAFLESVRELDTDTIPRPGTDIATAIDEASDALHSQPENMKFLIIISDGEDLEGRVLSAAKNAAQSGLKIFTVGVGTPAGDRIPERDDAGTFGYDHDLNGQEIVSKLDEDTLRKIASITGGAYAPLGPGGDGLEQVYDRYIAPLPKQNLDEKRQKIHIERFEWPLAAAILFLMWEFMINERIRSPKPTVEETARKPVRRRAERKEVAASALVLLVVAGIFPLRAADVADAERAYKAGDYDKSMQNYQRASETYPTRMELQFNRGDAAYKAGEYSQAEEAYRRSLETSDLGLQEQSYYNLGNTQYEHGAALQQVDPGKTIKLWEAALRSYACALQLKTAKDTQHNYEVVKRKLEQMKQQQSQGGQQGSSESGQGQSGSGSQKPGTSQSAGHSNSDNSNGNPNNAGNQGGPQKNGETANGEKSGQQQNPADGNTPNTPVRGYSGSRAEDQKDPQIRSREEAENLLDSLKDDERHVTARSLSSNGQSPPPPSGKDW